MKKENFKFAHKKEVLIIAGLAVFAVVLFFVFKNVSIGGYAIATIGVGKTQKTQKISLKQNGVVEIEANLPVKLEVDSGRIRFISSVCKDHNCERFGWLQHENDWAACLPAQVNVQVAK